MQLSVEIYLKVTKNKTIALTLRKHGNTIATFMHDGLIFSVIRSCSILI